MRHVLKIAAAALIGAMAASQALAADFTKGEVRKVDLKGKKVTVAHEELKALEMPPMTMVFRTATDEMLENMKEGQQIEFVAERVNGKLTITDIKD